MSEFEYSPNPQAQTLKQPLKALVDPSGYQYFINAPGVPILVTLTESVGSTTWTKTVFALNGASQTLLAANAARKGLIVANPVGNAQVSYDPAGGAVTLANGLSLLGGDRDEYDGPPCPLTAVTIIGTNTQNVIVYEGT